MGVVFFSTRPSHPTLSSLLSSSLSVPEVDFRQWGLVRIFGTVQIEPGGREEQGASISHDRSMVGLTTGQGAKASCNLLIESQCHC